MDSSCDDKSEFSLGKAPCFNGNKRDTTSKQVYKRILNFDINNKRNLKKTSCEEGLKT